MPAFLARLLNFTALGSVSMSAKSVELRAKVPEWNLYRRLWPRITSTSSAWFILVVLTGATGYVMRWRVYLRAVWKVRK
jgi:hypothetical protein